MEDGHVEAVESAVPLGLPRRGRRVARQGVFSGVFLEVVEEIEHQPAIFIGEISAVIFLSALFEKAESAVRSKLKAYGDKTGRQIIDALFKEVTVLGFIGLLLFLLTKSGAADSLAAFLLGGRQWADETQNPLAETFETVHIMIFMLLVVLLFQSLAVLVVTRQVSESWGRYERSRAFGTEETSLEAAFVQAGYLEAVHNADAPRQTELRMVKPFNYGDSFLERLSLRNDSLHKMVMFRAIRHEFLYPRKENRQKGPRVKDPATFSFENYLRNRLGVTVLALVEINIATWLATLVIMVPILYVTLQLPGLYAQAVQCTLAWLLVLVAGGLAALLEEDTYKFTPQVPEDARMILRLFAGTSTQMLRRASQVSRGLNFTGGVSDSGFSASGKRYRPGLGDAAELRKPKLYKPPFFRDVHPDRQTYLSSMTYEQALRFIGFLQAISITALIVSTLSSTSVSDPVQVALYGLTWLEWPIMLFKVVPAYIRRLTIRNSIEGKKDGKVINRVCLEGNDGLLRDFLLLVRLAGLGKRACEEQVRPSHVPQYVEQAVEEFRQLDQTEQFEIWNVFAVWDADNTGKVSPHEVSVTFQTMGFDSDVSEEWAEGMISCVDEEGDGQLTWRSMRAATVLTTSMVDQQEADLETFFELMDDNGDGAVTVFELTRGLRRMRIGLKNEDMANLLYQHFGSARLRVSKKDFVSWAKSIGRLSELRTARYEMSTA